MKSEVRKQKERWARKQKLKLVKLRIKKSQPTEPRTLRKSARGKIRRKKAAQNPIIPWAKERTWRYTTGNFARATLLAMPKEIRQQILLKTVLYDEMKEKGLGELAKWIMDLAVVSPVVRVDMEYLAEKWRKEWIEQNPVQPSVQNTSSRQLIPSLKLRRSDRALMMEQKKIPKRPQHCHMCWHRHYGKDPICPPAREDPVAWKKITRRIGERRGADAVGFKGKRIIWNDG
ncbi:hypothetical protein BCR34DRAFT_607079 [Clohesyomyces aquaticus]|uniref:Uncharacterized protein n=1 Tax=Clohesyomyces aquaticus TaxID=1231657 RepID=A0A1Y1YJ71_9PLEO|nr:hypothetical protein BCR34DRAFT_607079 [Clohesyomyces aquaticus]